MRNEIHRPGPPKQPADAFNPRRMIPFRRVVPAVVRPRLRRRGRAVSKQHVDPPACAVQAYRARKPRGAKASALRAIARNRSPAVRHDPTDDRAGSGYTLDTFPTTRA